MGDGAVWITNASIDAQSNDAEDLLPASVSRLDPESGDVDETIELRPAPGGHVYSVLPGLSVQHLAVSPDAVWAINRDLSVSRIDPRTNRIVAQVEGVKANNIAVGDGDVWVAEGDGLAEIDPSTNEVARRVPLDADLSTLAVGGGAVWVADPEGGNVWRVDTGPRLETTAIEVETWVVRLAFGEGALWATNEIADSIHRIDPRTGASRRVAGATSPRGVDAGDGTVWVTAATPPSEDAALPTAVCRNVDFGGDGSPDVLLVSSLPHQTGWLETTQPMVDAIRLVLRQRGYEAGAFSVGFQSCDSSTAQAGAEDVFRCGSNAKAFARNLKVVGVFGSFGSPCSYFQIPIANQASGGPLAMISPSNTAEAPDGGRRPLSVGHAELLPARCGGALPGKRPGRAREAARSRAAVPPDVQVRRVQRELHAGSPRRSPATRRRHRRQREVRSGSRDLPRPRAQGRQGPAGVGGDRRAPRSGDRSDGSRATRGSR